MFSQLWSAPPPAERMAMMRSIIGLLLISLIDVTLEMPSHTTLATAVMMMATATMPDASQAIAWVIRLVIDVIAACLLSELTLLLWTDQPWFSLPFAAMVFLALFYYSRLPGSTPFPCIFFLVALFYAPVNVRDNVYTTLDNIPIVLLAGAVLLLTHVVILPRRPMISLQDKMAQRLETLSSLLTANPEQTEPSAIGKLSTLIDTLNLSCKAHRDMSQLRTAYLALIHETEYLIHLLLWLQQSRHPDPLTPQTIQWHMELAAYCQGLADHLRMWHLPDKSRFERLPPQKPPQLADDEYAHWLEAGLNHLHHVAYKLLDKEPRPTEILNFSFFSETPYLGWTKTSFWLQPAPVPVYFGLKYGLGVLICLLLIQALEWQGIDTAMVTCIVIAQSSLGADYRKSLFRLIGAIAGGLLAISYIVVLLPALETIAGFLLAIAPAYALASRILVDARYSYVGMQIGYAFASVVLIDPGPVIDLTASRDRVMGILIGITVMGILDYLVWPHSASRQLPFPLERAHKLLGELDTAPQDADPEHYWTTLEQIDRELRTALDWLAQSAFEPLSLRHPWQEENAPSKSIARIHHTAGLVSLYRNVPSGSAEHKRRLAGTIQQGVQHA